MLLILSLSYDDSHLVALRYFGEFGYARISPFRLVAKERSFISVGLLYFDVFALCSN